jgi:hypothetical protein
MDDWQLLTLMTPLELKDDVVDALIACTLISGFNMQKIAGFSREHSQFHLREQVEGYREFYAFEVIHQSDQEDSLLDALRPVCESAGIRFWITPVSSQGHL